MTNTSTVSTIALSLLCVAGGCEQKNPNPTNTSNSGQNQRTGATSTPTTPSDMPSTAPTSRPADNTGRNEVDRSGDTKTPMDQSEASADIAITAAIRRAIMDDKSMSSNAQNCKVITGVGGVVTLRGPVNSQAEKDAIATKAREVAGVTRVNNQLEVTVK